MENFLINFFHLSQFKSVFVLFCLGVLFFVFRALKAKFSLALLMFVALILGFALGFFLLYMADFQNVAQLKSLNSKHFVLETQIWMSFLNSVYLSILKLLIIPLVFIALINVLLNLSQNLSFKAIFSRVFFWLLLSTAFCAIIGIVLALFGELGSSFAVVENTKSLKEIKGLNEVILGLIPSNIISAMNANNILGVIIFAFILAFGALSLKEKKGFRIFKLLVGFFYEMMIKICLFVVNLMPFFIVTMIASTLLVSGFESIKNAFYFILLLYVAFVLAFVLHAILLLMHGLNPIFYFKKALPALLMAFSSRSSAATLPVSISSLTQRLGVSSSTASFGASLGTTMGMNGCAGYYASMIAIFMFNALNIPVGFGEILMIVILCVITSFGIAGIPGITIMIISVMLSGLNLEEHFALLAVILAIDPILDMARTCTNVSGAMIASIITDKELKNLDIEKYKEI